MALPSYAITSDQELETAVRDTTSYDSTSDELPGAHDSGQMQGIINDAKRDMDIATGSNQWYSDLAYGQALKAHACILAKAAVENINIVSYSIGDESVTLSNADPEDSQQISAWAKQVKQSLDQSDIEFEHTQDLSFRNTSAYIG